MKKIFQEFLDDSGQLSDPQLQKIFSSGLIGFIKKDKKIIITRRNFGKCLLGQLKPAEPFDDLLDVWLLAKKFQ
jgi:hypothetical protein